MTSLPKPQVGLVIAYSFLWSEEAEQGQVEGRKDRPCAIVLALESVDPETPRIEVAVVPITHSPPHDPNVAVEIPPRIKAHLGLDTGRSWVILDELNVFTWPGYDLRPIRRGDERIDYGFLPPRFFDSLIEKFKALHETKTVRATAREP